MLYMGIRRAFNDASRHDTGREKTPDEREVLDLKSRSEIVLPDEWSFAEKLATAQQCWRAQSPDEAPVWVASDDPALGAALASIYECELREPLPDGEKATTAGKGGGK